MAAIYRDSFADKRRIYDQGHISISNKYNTPSQRSEDTQLAWITENSQLRDAPSKSVNAYHKRDPTIPDDTQEVTASEASGYLVGVFIIIIGFTISITIVSILCRRWYEKNLRREAVRFRGYQIKGRKAKPNKYEESNSRNPLEIKVEIFEKIERDDITIVGVPSPTFPPMKDRHSSSTTHSSLSEATRYSLVEPFYALNEKDDSASLVSLRIPPRSHSRNATDQRTPLKIANVQLEPISSMGLGWSGLSPPNRTDPKRSLLLLSSSGHDVQSWLYEDAFNGEYHDVVKFNQNAESERGNFNDTRGHGQGAKFTNRLTFGVSTNTGRDERGSDFKC